MDNQPRLPTHTDQSKRPRLESAGSAEDQSSAKLILHSMLERALEASKEAGGCDVDIVELRPTLQRQMECGASHRGLHKHTRPSDRKQADMCLPVFALLHVQNMGSLSTQLGTSIPWFTYGGNCPEPHWLFYEYGSLLFWRALRSCMTKVLDNCGIGVLVLVLIPSPRMLATGNTWCAEVHVSAKIFSVGIIFSACNIVHSFHSRCPMEISIGVPKRSTQC